MYKHPGVYIEHVPSGVLAIEAASTSTAAFIGHTRRGDLVTADVDRGEPVQVFNASQFADGFGERALADAAAVEDAGLVEMDMAVGEAGAREGALGIDGFDGFADEVVGTFRTMRGMERQLSYLELDREAFVAELRRQCE